ncbi:MAG: MATE family efflux transporter [Clostridia bacterium]|nr:MATE family efflux transporter [Clostridia bacterium]
MEKLFEGNIRKNFLNFAIPLVFSALLSQAYNIIDTVMASKLIGDVAVAAIGSTSPFITLISSIFWGYGTGFSIYIAVLFGSGEYKKMLNVIKTNLLIGSVAAILISVLCIVFYNSIFDFLNIEADIRKDAFAYFSVYIGGIIFLNLVWCGMYVSNSMGLSRMPFIASIVTCVLNITGNFVLIKICGLGVTGAAIATIFSAFCVAVFYIVTLTKIFTDMGLEIKSIYFSKEELKSTINYAVPSLLQQSVMYLCTAIVSPLTNLSGQSAIAGYTMSMRLYDLNAGVYQNANKTVSTYVAQCVGAKKYTMIKKGISTALSQTLLFLAPFLIVTVFGAGVISKTFLNETDSIHYCKVFLQFCMPFILFNVINNTAHAIFRSAGAGKFLVVSTVIYAVSRVIYSYALFGRYEMYGIYAAVVLSWITEAIFGIAVYVSGKWKSKEYKEAEKREVTV